MKTLLAIGAGQEQVYSISEAKRLGYEVVAVDSQKNAPGFNISDFFYSFDINNKALLLEIAKKHNIEGVVPSPVGRILVLTGFINDALGLKGINEKSAEICTNKSLFNSTLKNKLNLPNQTSSNRNDLREKIRKHQFPFVLKPNEGSGNRGIIVVSSIDVLSYAIDYHKSNLKEAEFSLIEDFIVGDEFGVSGFVYNGVYTTILIRRKEFTQLPFPQEIKYIVPSGVSKPEDELIRTELQKAISEIGLDNCLIQADLILDTNGKLWVIELSGRPSGHNITSLIIPKLLKFSFIELGISMITNKKIDPIIQSNNIAAVFSFFDFTNKTVVKIPSTKELSQIKSLVKHKINFKEGDFLGKIKNGSDISNRGFYFLIDQDLNKCKQYENQLISLFELK